MPCMCGDICCPSCGPAQGNSRCQLCGEWASEGCEHYDETTGGYKPEFQAQIDAAMKAENEFCDRLAADLEEEAKLAERAERGK